MMIRRNKRKVSSLRKARVNKIDQSKGDNRYKAKRQKMSQNKRMKSDKVLKSRK